MTVVNFLLWCPGQGCRNGSDCGHCHLCPAGESKMRRQVKLAALRTQDCDSNREVVELPELAEPIWRPPPGLELEMPLPPCPPPMMPPSLPSLGSVLHGSGECQPCLDFWSTEGCPRGHDCSQCHLCSAELKVQHQARMAGIVLQPISRALEFEEPIDEPSELSEPNASAQPKFLDPIPGPSFEQRTRFPSDQSLKQRLDRVLDEPEDVPCERGTKPPSTSTLRLPALHGCVICGSRGSCSCPRIHSGVALERLPSQDLETIQARSFLALSCRLMPSVHFSARSF